MHTVDGISTCILRCVHLTPTRIMLGRRALAGRSGGWLGQCAAALGRGRPIPLGLGQIRPLAAAVLPGTFRTVPDNGHSPGGRSGACV